MTSKLGGIVYPLKSDIVAFLSTKKTLRAFVRLTGQAGDRKKCDSYYLCFELLYGRCLCGLVAETGFEPVTFGL